METAEKLIKELQEQLEKTSRELLYYKSRAEKLEIKINGINNILKL